MSFRGLKISIIILRALPVRSLQGDFVSLVWRISGAGQNHDFWFVIWKSSGVGEVGKKRKSWESSLAYLSCRPTPVVIVYHRKNKIQKCGWSPPGEIELNKPDDDDEKRTSPIRQRNKNSILIFSQNRDRIKSGKWRRNKVIQLSKIFRRRQHEEMKIQDDSVEDLSVEMMLNNNNNRGETQLVCDIIVIGMRSMHERE